MCRQHLLIWYEARKIRVINYLYISSRAKKKGKCT
jgi:hypothetical protein